MNYGYDDTARIVTSKTKRTASAWLVGRAHYDVLGRVWRAETCEDGSTSCTPSVKTDTTFDAIGRTWKVTNPHRTTSDPTYGISESVFDGMGRVTKLIPPDGTSSTNHVLTQYAGNTVTVTDQAGKQRKSYTDALGRLIRVDEPGPSGPTGGTPGTGSVTISGSEQSVWVDQPYWGCILWFESVCQEEGWISNYVQVWDTGSVSITVNGLTKSATYGQSSTASTIATALRTAINVDSGYPVTAAGTGAVITLTAKTSGSATNYTLSAFSQTYDPANFSVPSFTATPSGSTLTGGSDGSPGTCCSLATPTITTYTYDTLDNLIGVLQGGSRQRTFTYNSLSQLLTAVNPESGTISYTYDSDGNVLAKTSPKQNQANPAVTVTTNFTYDALHRLKQKSYNDGATATVNYGYDGTAPTGCTPTLTSSYAIGRRTGMCDGAGWQAWSFDMMGAVLATRRATWNGSAYVTKDFSYTYNTDGSVATIAYPTGRTITYGYDAAGHALSGVDVANSINYATAATYAGHGGLATVQNGAGIVSTFYYNTRLQPCRVSVRSAGVSPANCADNAVNGNVLDFRYGFNLGTANNGNVAQVENRRDTNRTQNFSYDHLSRLESAQTTSSLWGNTYLYDIWGNLLQKNQVAGKTQGEFLVQTVSTNNQITGLSSDAAGNQTNDGSGLTFTYDAENRIISTGGVTYVYDGDGARLKKDQTGGSTFDKLYWYGAGSDTLTETNLTGTATADFIFFGGKRTARLDVASGTIHYYFSDHLGSASVVTNATGTTIEEESDYYPWGRERVIVDLLPDQNYKFTGKERDLETGLDYFGARYYSSGFGRFLTPDWAAAPTAVPYADFGNPQSLNLYTYVGNNPITRFDVDGHCWPVSECVTKFQNAVDSATEKVITAATNSGSPIVAATVTAYAGMSRDIANGTVDMFRAGEAVGSCMDSCTGVQMADAVGQDLHRTAGLVAMAAGGGEAVLEKVTQRALTNAATRAAETVGPGKGGVHGTKVHTEFSKEVNAKQAGLKTEVSYKNGEVVPRGTPGSVRVDAVRGNPARPQGVYDLKTGSAKLTSARKAEIQQHLPRRTSIKEIRPE